MKAIGVDPAIKGAMTILNEDGSLCAVYFWKSCTRNKKKVWKIHYCNLIGGKFVYDDRILNSMGCIGAFLAKEAFRLGGKDYFLACEDSYVGRSKKTSVIVARNSGRICGPMEVHALDNEPKFVRANAWRRAVIGTKASTKRHGDDESKGTKELSIELVPKKIVELTEVMSILGEHDDITDSGGIALWALKQIKKLK